jgi:hypothetical protein
MIKKMILLSALLLIGFVSQAQNTTRYGLKLGPTVGFQKWNYFQNDPLFKYHAAAWLESYRDEDPFSVLLQLGYHLKGSATRYSFPIQYNNTVYTIPTDEFIFRNLSLLAGVKRKYAKAKFSTYYTMGLRGEYTLSTNLDRYDPINKIIPVYPFNQAVKKVLLGFSLSGGLELPFGDLAGGILEFTIAPDITKQYYQPQIDNIIDIYRPGNTTSIGEKSIKNVTLERSFGIYFNRKVEYID